MKIVILTGAGISAESGLGTFRDKKGIWARYDMGEVATPEGFARDPDKVHAFYNARRATAVGARPNHAHTALGALVTARPDDVTLVTQNIDDLHEKGGADRVIHMHGQLSRALCAACGARWDAPPEMHAQDRCPACGARATRPDVVWFGEIPYHMERIATAPAVAELFVAIGTSGSVYPAAGFVAEARASGVPTLELNLTPSDTAGAFDAVRLGPATEVVPAWVAQVLEARRV
jgi:NAD-dependent deacetylase